MTDKGYACVLPTSSSHYERKLKHLNKQKEGKKRLRAMSFGRVQIPQESFIKLFDAKAK